MTLLFFPFFPIFAAIIKGLAIGAAIGACVVTSFVYVESLITEDVLREKAKNVVVDKLNRHDIDGLIALIKEKKKNAIKVGIFESFEADCLCEFECSSNEGVDDNLKEGMVINL